MICCNNDLGAFPHNEDIETGLMASQSGFHKIILWFSGARITRLIEFSYYEEIIIPKPFNENYEYKLQIMQPDGTLYEVSDCDNFTFNTYINLIDCGSDCP